MRLSLVLATTAVLAVTGGLAAADDLKIALIYGKTGPLEAYGKQTQTGLMMGLEYATGGTMTVDGRKIVVIEKDDQGKPDLGKSLLAEAYADDKADLAVGPTSSGVGARDAAGGRGIQEDPARRAGGRRLDHRRQMEPLHLPHRPQLARRTRSRTRSRSTSRASRSPRWRRTTPSAATA